MMLVRLLSMCPKLERKDMESGSNMNEGEYGSHIV